MKQLDPALLAFNDSLSDHLMHALQWNLSAILRFQPLSSCILPSSCPRFNAQIRFKHGRFLPQSCFLQTVSSQAWFYSSAILRFSSFTPYIHVQLPLRFTFQTVFRFNVQQRLQHTTVSAQHFKHHSAFIFNAFCMWFIPSVSYAFPAAAMIIFHQPFHVKASPFHSSVQVSYFSHFSIQVATVSHISSCTTS